MQIDRNLQRQILQTLQHSYPDSTLVTELPGFAHDHYFMGNLIYLKEHTLIEGGDIREPGKCRSMIDAQITKEGLDFLENDGGLKTILGDCSITIHKFEILEIIKEITQEEQLYEEVEKMDSESLKTKTMALIKNTLSQKRKIQD